MRAAYITPTARTDFVKLSNITELISLEPSGRGGFVVALEDVDGKELEHLKRRVTAAGYSIKMVPKRPARPSAGYAQRA